MMAICTDYLAVMMTAEQAIVNLSAGIGQVLRGNKLSHQKNCVVK